MKRTAIFLLALFISATLVACKAQKNDMHDHAGHQMEVEEGKKKSGAPEILYYTCSMHPFIREKEPGRCPVCGMPLVPKYADLSVPGEIPASDMLDRSSVQLSAEKLQLIGVMTEEIQKRALVRELEAFGRVAYDPDLYVAQTDYLIARRTGGSGLGGLQGGLVKAARSRLELLGMSDAEIRNLERSGRAQSSLMLPGKGEGVWIYGSIFESDLPWVRPGSPVEIWVPGMSKALENAVTSIDPTIDPGTRTAQLRILASNSEGRFKPNMFVKLRIKAGGEEVLTVPEDALVDTGKRKLVYVETAPGHFMPREVQTGRYGTGFVEVLSGMNAGEKVVTRGNFLIDSESSMKAAAGGGGHQH